MGESPLLEALNPFQLPRAKSAESVRKLLDSWRNVRVKDVNDKEREGDYTELSYIEEVRCLVASYYGRALESRPNYKSEWVAVGDKDSPDLALRCAAYGKGEISPAEIKAGFARDGTAFTLAVLSNLSAFTPEKRKVIEEECLHGRQLIALYGRRCKQRAEEWPSMDARPVSENGENLMAGIVPPSAAPPNYREPTVSELLKSISELTAKLATLRTVMVWGFVIVIALSLLRRM